MIKSVALFGSGSDRVSREYCTLIVKMLIDKGIYVLVYDKLFAKVENSLKNKVIPYKNICETKAKPDIVFSIGGDGTFLETIHQVKNSGIPIAGINSGRLGFLANIQDNLESSLNMLINSEFSIVQRNLIELIEPKGIMENCTIALNDITVQKSDLNMISIKLYVDDKYINTYWADGLIISTATGSTAYNLSIGGPILTPEVDNIIISPLSPHNLAVRPIILPGTSRLNLKLAGRSKRYLVTSDFRYARLPFDNEVIIQQAPYKIKTVNLKGQDFFSTLRNKLMWGADVRN